MNRSAATMLLDAGVNPLSRFRVQVAKVHEDLAYLLSMPVQGWAILTLADADGNVTEEEFNGPLAMRKARGRLNRLKRGEEVLA